MKNLKKVSKKIMTLLMLVLSIVMSVPANVFALTSTDQGQATGTAKVKVNGVETGNDSVTVNAYRIIDANVDNGQPKAPVYTWAPEVIDWVRANYPQYIQKVKNSNEENYFTDKDGVNHYAVAEEFTPCKNAEDTSANKKCVNAAEAKLFYDRLANAIRSYDSNKPVSATNINVPLATKKPVSAADGNIVLNLTMGNYLLLIEGGINVYSPSAINIVPKYVKVSDNPEKYEWRVQDTTIEVKSTTPSIDKKVKVSTDTDYTDNTQGNIGDTLNFEIKADIPTYPSNAISKQIIISDKFGTGLTFKGNVAVKAYKKDAQGNLTNPKSLTAETDYTLVPAGCDEEDTNKCWDFKVVFNNTQYEGIRDYSTIQVTYDGMINEEAVVGTNANTNKAILEYNNNPYSGEFHETNPDEVKVYTYGFRITKVDEANTSKLLPGAEFSISTDNNGKVGTVVEFVALEQDNEEKDIPGKYRKATAEDEDAGRTIYTTNLVVPESGILEVSGLAQGIYWITETKAPEGYVKLQKPFALTITDSDSVATLDGNVTDATNTDGYLDEMVKNSNSIITLPVTGGMGTLLFSVIGILFMGVGAFLIKNIFKKEDAE